MDLRIFDKSMTIFCFKRGFVRSYIIDLKFFRRSKLILIKEESLQFTKTKTFCVLIFELTKGVSFTLRIRKIGLRSTQTERQVDSEEKFHGPLLDLRTVRIPKEGHVFFYPSRLLLLPTPPFSLSPLSRSRPRVSDSSP